MRSPSTSTIIAAPRFRQFFRQLRGVLVLDLNRALEQHRPGIEPGLHLHDGDAGHFIAGHDRPLDRCGAAPAGQQRGVDVEAAQHRRVEDRLRQDQAVGRDYRDIGLQLGECLLLGLVCAATWGCAPRYRARSARSSTGVGRSPLPRPAGRGGWV